MVQFYPSETVTTEGTAGGPYRGNARPMKIAVRLTADEIAKGALAVADEEGASVPHELVDKGILVKVFCPACQGNMLLEKDNTHWIEVTYGG